MRADRDAVVQGLTCGEIVERLRQSLSDTLLSEKEVEDLVSAVLTGRHVLIAGPRGAAKDILVERVALALGLRLVAVHCSASLRREDLLGGWDPLALKEYGHSDERSHDPGAMERASGGILFLKDLDEMPESAAEALATSMDEGTIPIGGREVDADLRVFATANALDVDGRLLDRFQVVQIQYPESPEKEERFIAEQSQCRIPSPDYVPRMAANFLKRSRSHPDLELGASTRSGIRFVENVCASIELTGNQPGEEELYNSAYASFSHSIKPDPFSWKANAELVKSIFQEAVITTGRELVGEVSEAGSRFHRAYRKAIIALVIVALVGLAAFAGSRRGAGVSDAPVPSPSPVTDFEEKGPHEKRIVDKIPPRAVPVDPEDLSKLGRVAGTDVAGACRDPDTGNVFIETRDGTILEVEYDQGGSIGWVPEPSPGLMGGISPTWLMFSLVVVSLVAASASDRIQIFRRIRDSEILRRIRRRLSMPRETLSGMYREASSEVSALSQGLEGGSLAEAVKEISSARDETYAGAGKEKVSLADVMELARKSPDRYPALVHLLDCGGGYSAGDRQTIRELQKHLVREGLIRDSREVSFTHRVCKVLLSDLDERIMGRVYEAMQGVVQEELPPLPSSNVKDLRKYRRGDCYRDIAVRESIRDAIRKGRQGVDRDNLFVYEREAEKRELVVAGEAETVVVLDLSGSMAQGDKLWYAKQAVSVLMIIAERYGNPVGVVGFRDLSTDVAELGADRKSTISRVANLLPRGGTNIAAGIKRAVDMLAVEAGLMGFRAGSPQPENARKKHVILVTDGDATHPKPKQFAADYARRAAGLAAERGITISVVCIQGHGKDEEDGDGGHDAADGFYAFNPELAGELAEIGGGSLSFVKEIRDLSGVFVAEIDRLMSRSPAATIRIPRLVRQG